MSNVVVVDTNVPVTANDGVNASAACVLACIAAIKEITSDQKRIALDDDWRILSEYKSNLTDRRVRGVGDAFLKWVLTNWANPHRCDLVSIHERDGETFDEFPEADGLETFDPADRKFVAVANVHPASPPILQGVDSKWWGWRDALAAAGITVTFLCEADVRAWYEAKFGHRNC